MDKLITISLSYYNQSEIAVRRHLDLFDSYLSSIKELISVILIDDCSKVPVENLVSLDNYGDIDLSIYRVKEDLFCNISGTRNLAASLCSTPYLFILDMDTCIDNQLMQSSLFLAKCNIHENKVFKFTRFVPADHKHEKHLKPHPAVCLIRQRDYWNIGGCEEDLVGNYGYTDPCFWQRAKGKAKVHILKKPYLFYHPDGECNIVRDNSKNRKIFIDRCKNNNWSGKYLRFSWEKVT